MGSKESSHVPNSASHRRPHHPRRRRGTLKFDSASTWWSMLLDVRRTLSPCDEPYLSRNSLCTAGASPFETSAANSVRVGTTPINTVSSSSSVTRPLAASAVFAPSVAAYLFRTTSHARSQVSVHAIAQQVNSVLEAAPLVLPDNRPVPLKLSHYCIRTALRSERGQPHYHIPHNQTAISYNPPTPWLA